MTQLLSEQLSDRVYRTLKRELAEGRWPPGAQLKIRDLSDELGVSPMPVRVALKRLAAEGAVIAHENRSARVPEMNRKRFNELFEISIELESFAAERAATRISATELDALEREAVDLLDRRDGGPVLHRHNAFLMRVYQAADSRALVEMIEQVWLQIVPQSHMAPKAEALFAAKEMTLRLRDSTHALLRALRARDPAAARHAVASPLSYAQRIVNVLLDMDEDATAAA